jgi:C-8 sterol isomerase
MSNSQKDWIFNPKALHKIAQQGVGLECDAACDKIVALLKQNYPGHIRDDLPWIFNNAGGAMGQMKLLHVSLTEYIILFGSPIGTEGHSGRYAADVYDFVFNGEMWCYHEGETKRTVYRPGDGAHLGRTSTKGYRLPEGAFMLEYTRGIIPSMFFFGLADTVFSTLDVKVLGRTLGYSGKMIFSELLQGKTK